MATRKFPNFLYIHIKRHNNTSYIFLYFQVKAEAPQPQTRMEGFLNTVTERIRRAREERTRAELRKAISQGTKEKVEIKEESTSPSTSSPSNQCSVSAVSQGKQKYRNERKKVFHSPSFLYLIKFYEKIHLLYNES